MDQSTLLKNATQLLLLWLSRAAFMSNERGLYLGDSYFIVLADYMLKI